jgi:adenylate kinase family enzyme
MFWLKGAAGTGKSTISRTIAQRIKIAVNSEQASSSSEEGVIAAMLSAFSIISHLRLVPDIMYPLTAGHDATMRGWE